MPQRQVQACPRCRDDMFVRVEQVISGRRVELLFYCGACDYEWRTATAAPSGIDRRKGERRRVKREH